MSALAIFGFLHISLTDILDILCVALIIFFLFRWFRGSSGMNILIFIALLLMARFVVSAVGMNMMDSLLSTIIDVGAVALIVIFQPEIRRFLNSLGNRAGKRTALAGFIDRILGRNGQMTISGGSIPEVCEACQEMAAQKTGALIVIRHSNSLDGIISTGDTIDARISRRLIMNIFYKNSPLHDGAVIIGGDRIIAARCTLPMTDRHDIPANLGMRHKSAIGVSEQTDADVIVVSEQTGHISFVRGGVLTEIPNISALMLALGEEKKNDD